MRMALSKLDLIQDNVDPRSSVKPSWPEREWWVTLQSVTTALRRGQSAPSTRAETMAVLHDRQGYTRATLPPDMAVKLWRLFVSGSPHMADSFITHVSRLLPASGEDEAQQGARWRYDLSNSLHRLFDFDAHLNTCPRYSVPGIPYTSGDKSHTPFGALYVKRPTTTLPCGRVLASADATNAFALMSAALVTSRRHSGTFLAVLLLPHSTCAGYMRLARSLPSLVTLWTPPSQPGVASEWAVAVVSAHKPHHCVLRGTWSARAFPGPSPPTGTPRATVTRLVLPRVDRRTPPTDEASDVPTVYGARYISAPSPKFSMDAIHYTDASVARVAAMGNVATGAVYRELPHIRPQDSADRYLFDFASQVPNSNLAELATIRTCLEDDAAEVIATDSLASIRQIRGYLLWPSRYDRHPCRSILSAIAGIIRAKRAGVTLLKVKAHSGQPGNEWCDWHATQARLQAHTARVIRVSAPECNSWIYAQGDGTAPRLPLTGLGVPLQQICEAAHRMGSANEAIIYFSAYSSLVHSTHPSSHAFLSPGRCSWGERRLAIRYRPGLIYNNKLAHRYGRTASGECPLCGLPDSQTHMLGGCQHPVMHSIYCKRHNEAGRLILNFYTDSGMPIVPVQAHIGRAESSPALRHLPDVPPGCGSHHSRPDLTLYDGTAHLVEVKFGQDTRLEEKLPDIHRTLRITRAVVAAHMRATAEVRPVLLGVGGKDTACHAR